ncbi:hypothetical protein LGW56_09025, partial [Streptococcus mutans]|nr:hypothetical protein [Streptococcus mutans]
MNKLFNKTRKYTFFLIKRDGKYLLIYLVTLCFLILSQALSFANLYASATKRAAGAITMNNPAMIAISGPVYKTSKGFSLGALMSNQTLLYTAVIIAVVNIIFVTRNTRSDEESSRIELLKSLPIGRLTNYIATILITLLLNFLTFIILGIGLNALDIKSMDLNGSMLYGLILAATGLFFSSLTTLLSNFFIYTKNVYGVSFLFLGLSYVVRAIGDLNKNDITLFSPLGWVVRSRVYTKNNWSFSVLLIVLSIILF